MAVSRKGKEVVDAKKASFSAASSSSGGKRKRPLSAGSASGASPRGGGSRDSASGQRKRGRVSSSRFIDDAAVDADADSDEFDDDGSDGDFGQEEEPESMNDIQAGVKDTKGAGKSNIPFFMKEEELSGDELEEYVNRRYCHGSEHVMYAENDEEYDERKSLLHSTADPTVWRVRCMMGQERHIAFCLIQKYVSLYVRGSPLPIISVFSLEHVKGYVYIEADKQHDVAEACKGFCTMYTNKIGLVPSNEVPRLLSIQNKASKIAEGMWVRMKNGKYKGDLAQVVAVDDVRKRATVKLVPRIDLQALAKKFGGGISLRQAAVPAPRLISSRELEDFRPHIEIKRDRETGEVFEILDGLMLKDGYLYKKVSILSLSCFGVQPSDAELMKFEPAKRDEPQVSEYISRLYGDRKRNSLETETLEESLEDKGNTFKLYDLVLFGRKDFGVIIAMKCDNFQILKGGAEKPIVVTVERKYIKNSCVDKMFTASDGHMKTICINDTVKVLEGPQKDRQGIVKHMYKGTLFIYDEENLVNTGDEDNSQNTVFFCVKSELCEVMKDCHKNMGHKSCNIGSKGSMECSSMPQSPMQCSEQRDYDGGSKRYRQGDRDQPFTVGQTLRIRVGPLKGYLCRVVRIFRSEVTVKLDSLVKLITVNCNHLSDANIKSFGSTRDDTTFKPDNFGSQERLSKGELVNGDVGEPPSKSSWDFELPSSTRVSWPGLSTWGSSSANRDDNKGNDQGDDPWGSKVPSGDGCQAGHSDDLWGTKETSGNGCQGGHSDSAADNDPGGDPWGSKVTSGNGCQAGHSDDPWGSKVTSDDGCQAGHSDSAAEQRSQPAATDGWSNWAKVEKSTKGQHEKGNGTNEGEKGGWSKAISLNHGQADVWDKSDRPGNEVSSSSHGQTDNWSKGVGARGESDGKSDWGSHTDRPGHFERHGFGNEVGKADMDGSSNQEKAEKTDERKHEGYKGKGINECDKGGWSKAIPSDHGQSDGWNRGAGDGGASDGKGCWAGHTDRPGHFEVGQGSSSSWAKASTGGLSNWNSAEKSTVDETKNWKGNNMNEGETGGWSNWDGEQKSTMGESESWKRNKTKEGETGGWGKVRPSNNDQAERWNKGAGVDGESDGKGDWGSHSDRSDCFEAGQGFGSGRGSGDNRVNIGDRNQTGGWSKGLDVGGDYGSSRGRGRNRNNDAYGSGDKEDFWNKSRDSDGRQGWGRGRGFDGSGHGRNQDGSWKESGYSDAGWSTGRGRGRGRRGRGVWEARGSRDDYNDSSHSGRDAKDHSSGWKNDWGSTGRGGFSGDALSSWKSDQPSSWGTDTSFDDKKERTHSWGGKEPSLGGSSSWDAGVAGQSAPRNEGFSSERNEKPNMNQGCSSSSGWESVKLGVDPDKHVEQPATWEKEGPNKWSKPEACKVKPSSSSHAPDAGGNATEEGWSIKSKPSKADQSGGDTSASAGFQSAAWTSMSTVNEKVGEDGVSGGSWDRIKQSSGKEESSWSVEKRKDAGGGIGSWDNWKPSGPGSNSSSQEFGGANWNSTNPSYGGKQASDWQADDRNKWNRPKQFGGTHSSGQNSWSVGDGARRDDDRSGDWSGGQSYGGDRSSRGEGNMSSGRGNGRGRGKYFGQEHRSGWSGRTHSNQEAGGADFSEFFGRQESYGSQKPTGWTHDKFADKGSGSRGGHSGWSRGKDLAWGQSGDGKKGGSGEDCRKEARGTWGSWDSGAGNQASGSGWNTGDPNQPNANASGAWSRPMTTSQDVGCDQQKCLDVARGSNVQKCDAVFSEKASGQVSQGPDNWNKSKGFDSDVAKAWNSTSVSTKGAMSKEDQVWTLKIDSDKVDEPGCWSNRSGSFQQRDVWSEKKFHGGAHSSGDGSGRERSNGGSA